MGKLRSEFEKKYGFDGVDFVKQAGIRYFGIVKTLGLESILKSYAEEKGYDVEMNDEFLSHLIEAMAEAGEKFPDNQKVSFSSTINNLIVSPINPSVPKSKGTLQDFKNIVSDDDLRPVMMGVFVSDDGYLVGTDAHKLVKYKSNEFSKDKGKIIDLKVYIGTKGEKVTFIDEKYPNYEAIIPRNNEFKVDNLNTYAFHNLCKSAIALMKLQTNYTLNVNFKEGIEFALNPILFGEVLEFALAKGFDKFDIQFSQPNRAFLLKFEDGSEAIIMPVYSLDGTQGTKTYTFDEVQSEFSGGGKAKSKSKATPKATPKQPKKDVAYKKFEGDLSDVTYIPRRDISLIVLKNGEELSNADIIDGVYRLKSKKKFAKGGSVSNERYNFSIQTLEDNKDAINEDFDYSEFKGTKEQVVNKLKNDLKKKAIVYGYAKIDDGSSDWDYETSNLSRLRKSLTREEFAEGGQVGDKFRGIDLFQDYEYQEPKLRAITKKIDEAYDNDEVNTKFLKSILDKTEAIGYTFELDMDGSAYGLRPIGVEVEELEGYDEYAKGGSVSEKSILSFSFNTDNVKLNDVKKVVEQFSKDWRTSGDISEVNMFVTIASNKVSDLKYELKQEFGNNVYDVEVQKSRYAKGGSVKKGLKVAKKYTKLAYRKG